ncbi:MAG: DUF1318 domain-containing protein [Acidobacteriota bacterium]
MTTQSYWKTLFITVLALTAVACITINVYFPEAAVRDLSEKIEDAVAREAAKLDGTAAPDGGEGVQDAGQSAELRGEGAPSGLAAVARRAAIAVLDWTAGDASAQGGVASPEITNPAIRKIVESRAQRIPDLERYKSAGAVGENNRAMIEVRSLDALELRDRAAVQKLIREENADRDRMFKEIAAATKADLSQLPQIQTTYAETLRQNAKAGDWIQSPNGAWARKP